PLTPPPLLPCSSHPLSLHSFPTRRSSDLRSSSACVLRLPDASQGYCCPGQTWDLPVPARGVCVRARGLCPRGTLAHLAISVHPMEPSAYSYSVGVPE